MHSLRPAEKLSCSLLFSQPGGAGSLLGLGYNSYCFRAQESKLVELAAEADEFLAIVVKMKTKLELKAVSLEVEKRKSQLTDLETNE